MTVQVEIKCRKPELMPVKAHYNDAAYDVFADIKYPVHIPAMGREIIPTGFQLGLPDGYEATISPRSGLAAKMGLTVLNTPGTIDAGYRGEVKVILYNSNAKGVITIEPGDRIAQMKIKKVLPSHLVEVPVLDETIRGTKGFGSTGTKEIETKESEESLGTAVFITELVVFDPDSKGEVGVAIFKDMNSGAMFGIDTSFITELDETIVTEPFNQTKVRLLGI